MELVALLEVDGNCAELALSYHVVRPPTLQDFAQLLDCEKPSRLDLTAVVLVAAQPGPEEESLRL
jgi:hypothetical protein